jgi:hypothetical protein
MQAESKNMELPTAGATDTPAVPVVVDRPTWRAGLDALRSGRRRTPARVTRSPQRTGACRW